MIKKVSLFVVIFGIVTVVSVACASKPEKKEEASRVELKGVGELIYPTGIEVRNDIPFSLLVDESSKKILSDTIDYEKLRPDYVFLKSGFDEKDQQQLGSFPSIIVSILTRPDGSSFALGNETTERLLQNIIANMKVTGNTIQEWKKIDTALTLNSGDPGLFIAYKKVNNKTNKEMNVTTLYFLKNGKLVDITMSSPDSTYQEWDDYYKYIVDHLDLYI